MGDSLSDVRVVLFDVFGTLVDWRTSVTGRLAQFGRTHALTRDWSAVADDWRGEYQPSMEEVRSGRRGRPSTSFIAKVWNAYLPPMTSPR
jgi:2-haloacid dehalogenase